MMQPRWVVADKSCGVIVATQQALHAHFVARHRLAPSLPSRDCPMYSCTERRKRRRQMAQINVKVNGRAVARQVEDRTLLVEFLRETLGLTGTHVGCDTGQCGACVIHLDGRAVKSCTMMAAQASGSEITTIEGLAKGDAFHPMQAAFHEHHALQCGFCTPGMIMMAVDLLRRIPRPDEATIRANLDGNLCRCTGYHNIVKAIAAVAQTGAGA